MWKMIGQKKQGALQDQDPYKRFNLYSSNSVGAYLELFRIFNMEK